MERTDGAHGLQNRHMGLQCIVAQEFVRMRR